VALIPRANSGGGEGRSHIEALREEVHRFDGLTIQQSRPDRRTEFTHQPCTMRGAKATVASVFGNLGSPGFLPALRACQVKIKSRMPQRKTFRRIEKQMSKEGDSLPKRNSATPTQILS
jgi:hypothetical protein